jgi:hypothetical protein
MELNVAGAENLVRAGQCRSIIKASRPIQSEPIGSEAGVIYVE